VTASLDKTARLWDARTAEQNGTPLIGHEDDVTSAAFSPNGKRIVTTSNDGTARLWDAETGQQLAKLGHEAAVNSAVFSPDGKRIVTASDDGTARLWDAETEQQLAKLGHEAAVNSAARDQSPDADSADKVYSAAFSSDGKRIVASKPRD